MLLKTTIFLKNKVVDFNMKFLHRFCRFQIFWKEIVSNDANSRTRYLQTKFYWIKYVCNRKV